MGVVCQYRPHVAVCTGRVTLLEAKERQCGEVRGELVASDPQDFPQGDVELPHLYRVSRSPTSMFSGNIDVPLITQPLINHTSSPFHPPPPSPPARLKSAALLETLSISPRSRCPTWSP